MDAPTDSQRDGHRLTEAFYQRFTQGDPRAIADLLGPGWVNHPADPGQSDDIDGFVAGVEDFRAAFEGLTITREATVAEGDLIVCRIEISGRHVAEFAGYPATGREVRFPGMDMHRIDGGLIAETWHFEHLEGLAS